MTARARRPLARTSVRDALESAVIGLTAVGCDTPRLDAELLLAAATGLDRAAIVSHPARLLDPDAARRFQELVFRRRAREPVAYILGRKGFRFLDLEVDPRVLVPRPETEHLVEAALAELPPNARLVDVGTGSGAIALALKSERPDLEVVGTDVDPDALAVARANRDRLGLDVALALGDGLAPVDGRFDAVVSNPPYVADRDRATLPPEVVRFEPARALFAGPDGLAVIRGLVAAAAVAGVPWIGLEVGAGQADAVRALLAGAGWGDTDVRRDLAGVPRVVIGRRAR